MHEIKNKILKILFKLLQKVWQDIGIFDGFYRFTIRDAVTGEVKRVYTYHNIVPLVGRTMIANNLVANSPDNAMRINYVALGTGTNVPSSSDTKLQTETYRKTVASEINSSNIAYITGFFDATEVTGTLKEAGLFADATAVADSGIICSRVAIDVTKSGTETLTIDWTLTIS